MSHLHIVHTNPQTLVPGAVVERVWLVPNGQGAYFVYSTANVAPLCEALPHNEAERVARDWAKHLGGCYDEAAWVA